MPRPPDPNARVDLLRAAAAVFLDHGVDGARVEAITARAGRGKGSFYLHFEDKADAFRQIVEPMLAGLAACLERQEERAATASGPRDLSSRWLHEDEEVFDYLWQNRSAVRLLFQSAHGAGLQGLADQLAERIEARLGKRVAEAAGLGLARERLDADALVFLVAGAYERLARALVRRAARPALGPLVAAAGDLLLHAIAPAGGEPVARRRTVSDPSVKNPPARGARPERRAAGAERKRTGRAAAVATSRSASVRGRGKPAAARERGRRKRAT